MIGSYDLRLRVCQPDGKVIHAKISQLTAVKNRLELPFIKAVGEDKIAGFASGRIIMTYERKHHIEAIEKLTQYLESLFMKELSNADNNTSNLGRSKSAGTKIKTDPGATNKSKGKGRGGVHNSRGRGKSSNDIERREPKPSMAESCDSENKGSN